MKYSFSLDKIGNRQIFTKICFRLLRKRQIVFYLFMRRLKLHTGNLVKKHIFYQVTMKKVWKRDTTPTRSRPLPPLLLTLLQVCIAQLKFVLS